jgi:hypothetical protein
VLSAYVVPVCAHLPPLRLSSATLQPGLERAVLARRGLPLGLPLPSGLCPAAGITRRRHLRSSMGSVCDLDRASLLARCRATSQHDLVR